jgi:hypothetical protein
MWQAARDLDPEAKALHAWHAVRCGEALRHPRPEDETAIELHRRRSYGRDPVGELERNPRTAPDLPTLTGIRE